MALMNKKRSLLNKLRTAWVKIQAKSGYNLGTVSASRTEKLRLMLRPQFNAAALYPELMQKGQFFLFGDTNHSDARIQLFFYSPENVAAMARAGIRHIAPEIEPEYQDIVNEAAAGRIAADDFFAQMMKRTRELGMTPETDGKDTSSIQMQLEKSERYRLMAEGLVLMHKAGMKIHCLDDRSHIPKEMMKGVVERSRELRKFIASRAGPPAISHGKVELAFMMDRLKNNAAQEEKILRDISSLIHIRKKDDAYLAARIADAAGEEKAAILFGDGHAREKNGLYENLGRHKTVYVALHGDKNFYADRPRVISRAEQDNWLPDYVHIIRNKKLYRFEGLTNIAP